MLPFCREHNITVIAYSPLDQGSICRERNRKAQIEAVADKYGCTIAQLTLNWLVTHGGVVVIPKSAQRNHLLENIGALDFNLDSKDIAMIAKLTQPIFADVSTERIRVTKDATGRQKVYTGLDDAISNIYDYSPSPTELSEEILNCGMLKRVKVCPTDDNSGRFDYDLIEGRSRYWAWVIAHDGKCDIPVLVLPHPDQQASMET